MLVARISAWLTIVLLFAGLAGCGSSADPPPTASISGSAPATEGTPAARVARPDGSFGSASQEASAPKIPEKDLHPQVVIETTSGDITVRMDAEKAPLAVENFLENYVDRDFYTGTIFHYVEKDFIIIAGGYTSDGQAKEARAPIRNEADNGLKNRRGTIAMARQPEYVDSATSQFFINLADNSQLDYAESDEDAQSGYCVFGEIVAGMDVAEQIAQAPIHDTETLTKTPVEPVTIKSVRRLK